MDINFVNQYTALIASKLPAGTESLVRDRLMQCTDPGSVSLAISHLKDPTVSLVLSILIGQWAIDRFYIGDVALGILKILTCGGIYIWWIIDIFVIMDATRRKNFEIFQMYVH